MRCEPVECEKRHVKTILCIENVIKFRKPSFSGLKILAKKYHFSQKILIFAVDRSVLVDIAGMNKPLVVIARPLSEGVLIFLDVFQHLDYWFDLAVADLNIDIGQH